MLTDRQRAAVERLRGQKDLKPEDRGTLRTALFFGTPTTSEAADIRSILRAGDKGEL